MLETQFKKGIDYFDRLFNYLDDFIDISDTKYEKYLALKDMTRRSYMHFENDRMIYAEAMSRALNMTAFFDVFGEERFVKALEHTNGGSVESKLGVSIALVACKA